MAALGMLLNIILNLVFIPMYNASGSAFSSLFTQALTAICQVIMVQKVFKFHVNYKFLSALLLFVVLLLSSAFILNLTTIRWEQQVVFLGVFSVCLALTLRIINIKKLIVEFKSS
jgi:O-antigen/teichoic acid export membrane protein